jgi:hypothetical protein
MLIILLPLLLLGEEGVAGVEVGFGTKEQLGGQK